MANPVVVEIIRGPLPESRHRGALAVANAEGLALLRLGNVDSPVYPRSAVKALQAIALMESGAADALGLTDAEIALACASHNGEPPHVAAARAMLAKAGFDETDLECGAHPTRLEGGVAARHISRTPPSAIHNNCSGKHAGMLALARHMGVEPAGYSHPDHPVQMAVRRILAEVTGARLTAAACGTDGCSIPTWAMPLSDMAAGFARFATGQGMPPERAAACVRIRQAVGSHPFMVAGTGRFCTTVMEATGPAIFVKTGAEGVFCAAFPDRGLGLALKIDDGSSRASEALMAAAALALADPADAARAALERLAAVRLRNWSGQEVGEIRVSAQAMQRLRTCL